MYPDVAGESLTLGTGRRSAGEYAQAETTFSVSTGRAVYFKEPPFGMSQEGLGPKDPDYRFIIASADELSNGKNGIWDGGGRAQFPLPKRFHPLRFHGSQWIMGMLIMMPAPGPFSPAGWSIDARPTRHEQKRPQRARHLHQVHHPDPDRRGEWDLLAQIREEVYITKG